MDREAVRDVVFKAAALISGLRVSDIRESDALYHDRHIYGDDVLEILSEIEKQLEIRFQDDFIASLEFYFSDEGGISLFPPKACQFRKLTFGALIDSIYSDDFSDIIVKCNI